MDDPVVTVVIPTRNRRALLEVTLGAVLRQDVPLEVVVVDEGSDDGTGAWLAALGDARVRTVRHDRPQGVARARNAGIEQARAPWLAFLDDDDRWAPDKLDAQLTALAARPEAAWSAVGAVSVDVRGRRLRADDPPPEADLAPLLLESNRIPGGASGVVARTDLVRELGGFDHELSVCADWDLWIRLSLHAPVASVHRPLVAYLVHDSGMSLDIGRYRRERRYLEAKYATECSARGVVIDERRADLWGAMLDERAGNRWSAATTRLRWAWRDRSRRGALDAAKAAVIPRLVAARRDARQAEQVPVAWQRELAAWLPEA
jgi:glycosyltransferase involved in cell wall biosynthesis